MSKGGTAVLAVYPDDGVVVAVNDAEVTLKVDDSSNTRIKFSRSAIQRVTGSPEGDKSEK